MITSNAKDIQPDESAKFKNQEPAENVRKNYKIQQDDINIIIQSEKNIKCYGHFFLASQIIMPYVHCSVFITR
jgi:hypothetical protein